MNLTSKQIAFLKSQANNLSPIFQIGKSGLSEEHINQINEALEKRELIKIQLLQNTLEDPKDAAQIIAKKIDANVVQVIGRVVILFKKSSKEENRKISLELPQA